MTSGKSTSRPVLNYAPRPRRRWVVRLVIALALAVAAYVGLVVATQIRMVLEAKRAHRQMPGVECLSSLRSIGIAILIFAHEPRNRQRLPASFDQLELSTLSPRWFVCPCSGDVPAPGDGDEWHGNLFTGGHCTYIYVGRGLTLRHPDDTPIAYEPLVDHGNGRGMGMHVAFLDGHVEWIPAAKVPQVLTAEVLARTAATRPSTVPSQ